MYYFKHQKYLTPNNFFISKFTNNNLKINFTQFGFFLFILVNNKNKLLLLNCESVAGEKLTDAMFLKKGE